MGRGDAGRCVKVCRGEEGRGEAGTAVAVTLAETRGEDTLGPGVTARVGAGILDGCNARVDTALDQTAPPTPATVLGRALPGLPWAPLAPGVLAVATYASSQPRGVCTLLDLGGIMGETCGGCGVGVRATKPG